MRICQKNVGDVDSHCATLSIAHCQTTAVQQTTKSGTKGATLKESITREESDDDGAIEEESSDDTDDDPNELDFERTPQRASDIRKRRSQKKLNQKNIKQRVVKLLRRFKVAEENNVH